MSQKHKQHSDRALQRAVKAQKKDLRKIMSHQWWIDYHTKAVETSDYPAPLADSYNKRDQKRIDKLVARCMRRAVKYGIPTYKPPADAQPAPAVKVDVPQEVKDGLKPFHRTDKQQAAYERDMSAKAVEVEVSDVEAPTAEALRQEAQVLYDRGAITEAALQLAKDVADVGDADCIRRSVENLRAVA